MLLPQTAEYALRALACLAHLPEGEGLRSTDISERAAVPLAYLQKVLRRLVEAGLLESQKGHHGGFRLAKDPASIRFVDVLEAAEMDTEQQGCAFGWDRCDVARPCPLHPSYAELKECFQTWAARRTLADVLPPAPLQGAGKGPSRAAARQRR